MVQGYATSDPLSITNTQPKPPPRSLTPGHITPVAEGFYENPNLNLAFEQGNKAGEGLKGFLAFTSIGLFTTNSSTFYSNHLVPPSRRDF